MCQYKSFQKEEWKITLNLIEIKILKFLQKSLILAVDDQALSINFSNDSNFSLRTDIPFFTMVAAGMEPTD